MGISHGVARPFYGINARTGYPVAIREVPYVVSHRPNALTVLHVA